ncbi:hypothetical protein ECANGB1_1553 [Enterospora canceri]|uniref:Uncharacterized protein n=1 Tax=Enterospora canceri TaxID=1081671 RepID=A0A1Y1S5U8_9MICR|nr:hypothetical protein ECANGB1_1553 [Enterospora canceri]
MDQDKTKQTGTNETQGGRMPFTKASTHFTSAVQKATSTRDILHNEIIRNMRERHQITEKRRQVKKARGPVKARKAADKNVSINNEKMATGHKTEQRGREWNWNPSPFAHPRSMSSPRNGQAHNIFIEERRQLRQTIIRHNFSHLAHLLIDERRSFYATNSLMIREDYCRCTGQVVKYSAQQNGRETMFVDRERCICQILRQQAETERALKKQVRKLE